MKYIGNPDNNIEIYVVYSFNNIHIYFLKTKPQPTELINTTKKIIIGRKLRKCPSLTESDILASGRNLILQLKGHVSSLLFLFFLFSCVVFVFWAGVSVLLYICWGGLGLSELVLCFWGSLWAVTWNLSVCSYQAVRAQLCPRVTPQLEDAHLTRPFITRTASTKGQTAPELNEISTFWFEIVFLCIGWKGWIFLSFLLLSLYKKGSGSCFNLSVLAAERCLNWFELTTDWTVDKQWDWFL